MLFKPKFFLDLSGEGDADNKPVQIAPVRQAEPEATKAAPSTKSEPGAKSMQGSESQPAAMAAAVAAPAPAPAAAGSPTTAEAIAAELAAAQANRPAPSQATFAPDCLAAGAAVPRRRRLAGANLGPFKQMAQGMMKN